MFLTHTFAIPFAIWRCMRAPKIRSGLDRQGHQGVFSERFVCLFAMGNKGYVV